MKIPPFKEINPPNKNGYWINPKTKEALWRSVRIVTTPN